MEEITVVKLDTEQAQKSLKDLRNELKSIKDSMTNLEEGSDAFLEAANKAGTLKHQIDEINQTVRGASADFGDMLSNSTKAVTGIIGGFQAAQGALTLFGVESEEVTKAIQKMQASMAVIQGLQAIDDGIKSFAKLKTAILTNAKALGTFKSALIATGLGALLVVLGEIIAHWDTIAEKLGIATKAQRDYNGEADRLSSIYQHQAALARAKGEEEQKVLELEIKGYDAELEVVTKGIIALRNKKKLSDDEAKQLDDLRTRQTKLYQNIEISEAKITKIKNDNLAKQKKAEEDAAKEREKLAKERREQAAKDAEDARKKAEKDAADAIEKARKDAAEQLDIRLEQNKRAELSDVERLEREKEIEEERLLLYTEGTLEYEKQLTKISELKNKITEASNPKEDNKKKDAEEVLTLGEQIALSLNSAQAAISLLGSDSNWGKVVGQIQNIAANWDTTVADIKKGGKSAAAAIGSVGASTTAALGAMFSALANEQDTSTKEGFEQSKKLQVAATTMNMFSGIMAAWTSSLALPAPASFILGAIQTAATAALGAAQIANIQKQTFDSASSASASVAASPSALSATIIPPVQYSQAVQGASTESAITDTKAYVAVTEIERVSNNVSVAEMESRY